MNTIIEKLINAFEADINSDVVKRKDSALMWLFLDAYNRYQEDECDGVNYIFDINKKEDLKCCIDGGLSVAEISDMHYNLVHFFLFNSNGLKYISNFRELLEVIGGDIRNVVAHTIAYATRCEEYAALYEHYVTERMTEFLS